MEGVAFAADAAAGAGGAQGLMSFLPLVLIFVVFYFLLIRPQQKKAKDHQEFIANLKKGDEVLTSGGLQGKITGLTERVATLEIAENVRVKIARAYILGSIAALEGGEKKEGAACASGGKGC